MKKICLVLIAACLMCGCAITKPSNEVEILTLFNSSSKSPNKLWVGTFQLAFNDMKNNIFKKDIIFENEKPTEELKGLNNEEFNKTMLDGSSYYTSWGETSPEAKEKIIKAIKDKFNEKSDIIDNLDWRKAPGRYYAYAMLKKQFEFFSEFDKLEKFSFNNSSKTYPFFGINSNSDKSLRRQVEVLFYNNENDFAIKLPVKNGSDGIYLYRTDKNSDFRSVYLKMLENMEKSLSDSNFGESDTLKIPNLKIKAKREYPEICNKIIEGTDLYFSAALETIDFELDNKGGKIKSEAAIMTDRASLIQDEEKERNFDFDKTFFLFLTDKGKTDPYFALRVNDLDVFNK